MTKQVNIVGTGLIGGSISAGLRAAGWQTFVSDRDEQLAKQAVAQGVADVAGLEPDAEITVLATPVGQVPDVAADILGRVSGVVTDVGSTKADICKSIDDPRFIGGHPMAGSEQDGLSGARADLFRGAIWVLTPSAITDESAVMKARQMVAALEAEMLMLPPLMHDRLVAKISHVPHLTAATLMNLADESAVDQQVLLRLAAGGFRDMTRISAGQPTIWPDICFSNKTAIVGGLDQLINSLTDVRESVRTGDRERLLGLLERARRARLNLPIGFNKDDSLVEVRVLIPDEPGQIATVSNLAAEHDTNIYDLEISHSAEGQRGVMVLLVSRTRSDRLEELLAEKGYSSNRRSIQ